MVERSTINFVIEGSNRAAAYHQEKIAEKKVKSIFKRSGWKNMRDASYREDNDNILKINRFMNMSEDRQEA